MVLTFQCTLLLDSILLPIDLINQFPVVEVQCLLPFGDGNCSLVGRVRLGEELFEIGGHIFGALVGRGRGSGCCGEKEDGGERVTHDGM